MGKNHGIFSFFGMLGIGALLGWVARFNLAECRTVTRLLLTVISIEMLIHGFESSIGSSYVVWLRSVAAIGLFHLVFARVSVTGLTRSGQTSSDLADRPSIPLAPYPNLMR